MPSFNMMEGALTGKTGFYGQGRLLLRRALSREGKTFSIALLACGWPNHKSWKWHDAKLLYEYGLANYEKRNIYEKGRAGAGAGNGESRRKCPQVQEQEISLLLCDQDEVRMEAEIPETMEAPVQAGKTVGFGNLLCQRRGICPAADHHGGGCLRSPTGTAWTVSWSCSGSDAKHGRPIRKRKYGREESC